MNYTIPNGTKLNPTSEFRIYSKSGAETTQMSWNESGCSSSSYQKVTLENVYAMGIPLH